MYTTWRSDSASPAQDLISLLWEGYGQASAEAEVLGEAAELLNQALVSKLKLSHGPLLAEDTLTEASARLEAAFHGGSPLLPAETHCDDLQTTPKQRMLWMLDRLGDARAQRRHVQARYLPLALAGRALEQTFDLLLQAHPYLGMNTVTVDRKPVLERADRQKVTVVDLSALPLPTAEKVLACLQQAPQMLSGSSYRLLCCRLASARFNLTLALNPQNGDDWGAAQILDQWCAYYRSVGLGTVPKVPVKQETINFCAALNRWLDSGENRRQLAYWKQQLVKPVRALALPADGPRNGRGLAARLELSLPAGLTTKLRALARLQGVPVSLPILTAWSILIWRISGASEIPMGLVINGEARDRGFVGAFGNTVLARLRVRPDSVFTSLLQEVTQAWLCSSAFRYLPWEQVQLVLEPKRENGAPLPQVAFDAQGCTPPPAGCPLASHDLALALFQAEDGLAATLIFDQNLFQDATISRIGQYLLCLLGEIVAQPTLALAGYGLRNGDSTALFPYQLFERDPYHYSPLADLPSELLNQDAPVAPPLVPLDRSGATPLSFGQKRLWFMDQLEQGNTTYNMATVIEIEGHLDVDAVAFGLSEIVRRHEVLRTTFPVVQNQASQVIAAAMPLLITVVDLTGISEVPLTALAKADALRPFHLARGPLLRLSLLRLAPSRHLGLLNVHHIVSDGWSTGILITELAELYASRLQARPVKLASLPLQYGDFAQWQNCWMQGPVLAYQLRFWRKYLAGAPELLELPLDRPRPAVRSVEGATEYFHLDLDMANGLRGLGRKQRASLFMTLFSAFSALLYRYTGQADLVLGSPISGRERQELHHLIGFFVNTLVLRNQVVGEQGFNHLLAQVRGNALAAYAHQDVSFEQLVEDLNPTRNLSFPPIFQVMFGLQNAPLPAFDLPGLQLRLPEVELVGTKFDLSVSMWESGAEISGYFSFSTQLFDRATIRRMQGHFQALLKAIVAHPDRPIERLNLISDQERRLLEGSWHADREISFEQQPFTHQLFEATAARRPMATALELPPEGPRTEPVFLSYSMLNGTANRLAKQLRSLGGGSHSRVGICLPRSQWTVMGVLATLKAGAAYLPLDAEYPRERLAFMIEDAGVEHLLTHSSILERVSGLAPQLVLVDQLEQCTSAHEDSNLNLALEPNHEAYIIYTSGTTGQPKGVLVSHGNLRNFVWGVRHRFAFGEDTTMACYVRFSFDIFLFQLTSPLMAGGTCLFLTRSQLLDDPLFSDILRRLTVLHGPPSVMIRSMDLLEASELVLREVQYAFVGGDLVPPSLLARMQERLPQAQVFQGYGPTEGTIMCSNYLVPRDGSMKTHVIGQPMPGVTIRLYDRRGNLVPVGVPGEIYIGGAATTAGYLAREELNQEKFVTVDGQRFYRTGDLARFCAQGNLDFMGRIDNQIKIRGFRIEPGEVERKLLAHPQVGQALVLVKEIRPGDRQLVAYVTAAKDKLAADASQLRSLLVGSLPDYMIPAAFVTLPQFPLTINGKVDHGALPLPLFEERATHLEPRSPSERAIARIFSDILQQERISTDANFFELGGHSLLGARVIAAIREDLAVDIGVRAIFECPTIRDLARRVDSGSGTQGLPTIEPVGEGEAERMRWPLSFAQRRMYFLDKAEQTGHVYNMPLALRLKGSLDTDLLEKSLNSLLARHDTLRTLYVEERGLPLQVVVPHRRFSMVLIDLNGLLDREQVTLILARADAERPFALAVGPMFRPKLIRLADREHLLLLTLHHISADAASGAVFLRQLQALYASGLDGQTPSAEVALSYIAYSRWQHRLVNEGLLVGQKDYWCQQLSPLPSRLELPRETPSSSDYDGSSLEFTVSPQITARAQALSLGSGCSLFMTLQAVFALVLNRITGALDIAIGTPIAGRDQPGLQDVIGLFVNTLVLRHDLSGNPSFSSFLQRVRSVNLDAFSHGDLPFDQVVDAVCPGRSLKKTPLFQVMFVLQNANTEALRLPGVMSTPLVTQHYTAKFDLTLFVRQQEDRLSCTIEYASVFRSATVGVMANRFVCVLDQLTTAPDTLFSQVMPFLEGERQQVLENFNQTRVALPVLNLAQIFAATVAAHGQNESLVIPAFHGKAESLSYSQVEALAHRIAHRLRQRGASLETPVALFLERDRLMVPAILAVLMLGATFVPLDPSYPSDRLTYMLADCAAPLLLTSKSLLADMPSGRHEVMLVEDREGDETVAAPTLDHVGGEHLAYIMYTSGSTGKPKGVCVPHQAVARLVIHSQFARLDRDCRWLQMAPISFDASTLELWGPLLNGGVCVLYPQRVPEVDLLARVLRDHQVNSMWLTSSLFNLLIDQKPQLFAGLTQLFIGGEALSPDHVRKCLSHLPDLELVNGYGPTENTTFTCCFAIPRNQAFVSLPIGSPVTNTSSYVLDGKGLPVGIGEVGELCTGGAGLARGYLSRPGLTAERFVPNPFGQAGSRIYTTGDRVRWIPGEDKGVIAFMGRVDDQIKLRGFRIELGEIEAALMAHEAVSSAAVVLVGDGGEKRLVGYLHVETVGSETRTMAAQFRSWLAGRLPDYMVPTQLVLLDALPLNSNGKVNREALPMPQDDSFSDEIYTPARSALEATLVTLWQELLGKQQVGIHDNFFELGGDSILSIQFVARAREAGLNTSNKMLFEHQTIAALAPVVTPLEVAIGSQGPVVGEAPLSPIQHWFFELAWPNPNHFNQSVMLRLPRGCNTSHLDEAFMALGQHHDSLRLRFHQREGRLLMAYAPVGESVAVEHLDLTGLPPAEGREALLRNAQAQQCSLHLQDGPTVRAAHYRLAEGQERLLVVMHHQIVDGVSWRLLLEDLGRALGQLQRGEAIVFPRKTSAFSDWSKRLLQWAESPELAKALDYWRASAQVTGPGPIRNLAFGFPDNNLMAGSDTTFVSLGEAETAKLLGDANKAFNTRPEELMIAALATTLVPHGNIDLRIALEGHGREELFEELDLTRTVGWFTALYPVVLPAHAANTGTYVKAVKEALRLVPNKGVSYGVLRYLSPHGSALVPDYEPDVVFNYLGQTGLLETGEGIGPVDEPRGAEYGQEGRRPFLLEINGMVLKGCLRLGFSYHRQIHRAETIEGLAQDFLRNLRDILGVCGGGESGFTPSDFLNIDMDQDELDSFLCELDL